MTIAVLVVRVSVGGRGESQSQRAVNDLELAFDARKSILQARAFREIVHIFAESVGKQRVCFRRLVRRSRSFFSAEISIRVFELPEVTTGHAPGVLVNVSGSWQRARICSADTQSLIFHQ